MKALTGKAFKAFKSYIKKENGWTNDDFNNHYNCQGYNKYSSRQQATEKAIIKAIEIYNNGRI